MYYIYSYEDYKRMIEHWIATSPNSYLGQDNGFNIHEVLLKPLSADKADFILSELKSQIPPLQLLGNKLEVTESIVKSDTKEYYISIAGKVHIPLKRESSQDQEEGDLINANGQ